MQINNMEDFQNKLIENLQIELDDYYSEDNQNESTQ
jgi:hypothetical protein